MPNKTLFNTKGHVNAPPADTVNAAGGLAYSTPDKHALAQYAATGCFNGTYYAKGEEQLNKLLGTNGSSGILERIEPEFIAKVAVYSYQESHMKDMPAFLLAWLCGKSARLQGDVNEARSNLARTQEGSEKRAELEARLAELNKRHGDIVRYIRSAFPRVITSGRMLRGFVQIIRSGVVGRRSFGTQIRNLIRELLARRSDEQLLSWAVGQEPSLKDIIKMVHPRPVVVRGRDEQFYQAVLDAEREELHAYLIGKKYERSRLPGIVRQYEDFKAGRTNVPPGVEFRLLTGLPLKREHWVEIARNMRYQATRINLNTLNRHDVFKDVQMVKLVAERLRDAELIKRARVFPYQLFSAYLNTRAGLTGVQGFRGKGSDEPLPYELTEALQDAAEIAVDNVPGFEGNVVLCPDVSGSMYGAAITGKRKKGQTSAVRCIDVAAFMTTALMRKNPRARVLPFEAGVVEIRPPLNARDSIMTNAEKLAAIKGGATNISAPLQLINRNRWPVDLVVFISDHESWYDTVKWKQQGYLSGWGWGHQVPVTPVMAEWEKIKRRNRNARMICIDITPKGTGQTIDRDDILNVGGWNDSVFDVIKLFMENGLDGEHWVNHIDRSVTL